ncbi:hypothetical protein ABIB40_002773 [Pedobacter sp. UYP30]
MQWKASFHDFDSGLKRTNFNNIGLLNKFYARHQTVLQQ